MSAARRRDHRPVALLLAVQTPEQTDARLERSLDELEQLVLGLGMTVGGRMVQKRPNRTAPTYLGAGKLRELGALTGGPGELPRGPEPPRSSEPPPQRAIEVVVVDDELDPGQQRALEVATGAEILDRTAVILQVFASRARTREARLQVELARLQYELPRLRDDRSMGDREGGGGRGGRGHSNVELAKQRARERIASLKRELEQLAQAAQTGRRGRAELFRVALVGYTNAGKSSIMRLLTGSEVLVKDQLFATLDTTVRQLMPAAQPPVLVADTVGFLSRLPHALVASFRSTLDETREAWLLLHVVDASHPDFREQMRVTDELLAEVSGAPSWLLLNKVDRLDPEAREALAREWPEALQMSALRPEDGQRLRERINAFFEDHLEEARLELPLEASRALAELRPYLRVLSEEYGEMLTVTVRATPEILGRLRKRLESVL